MSVPNQNQEGDKRSATGGGSADNIKNGDATIASVHLSLGLGRSAGRSGYNRGPKTLDTVRARSATPDTPELRNVILGGERGGVRQTELFVSYQPPLPLGDGDGDYPKCPGKAKQLEKWGMEYLPECGFGGDFQWPTGAAMRCCDEKKKGPCLYRFRLNGVPLTDDKGNFLALGDKITGYDTRKRIIVSSIAARLFNGCPRKYIKGASAVFHCPEAKQLILHPFGTDELGFARIVAKKKLTKLSEIWNPDNWEFPIETEELDSPWNESEWVWTDGSNLDKVLKCLAGSYGIGEGTQDPSTGTTPGCSTIASHMAESEIGTKMLFNLGVPYGEEYGSNYTGWYAIKITAVKGEDKYGKEVFHNDTDSGTLKKVIISWEWGMISADHPCPITGVKDGFDKVTGIYPTEITWIPGDDVIFTDGLADGTESSGSLDCPDGTRNPRKYHPENLNYNVKINFYKYHPKYMGMAWWTRYNPVIQSVPHITGTYMFSPKRWGSMVAGTGNQDRCQGGSFGGVGEVTPVFDPVHDPNGMCRCSKFNIEDAINISSWEPCDDLCSVIYCRTKNFPDNPTGNEDFSAGGWETIREKHGELIKKKCTCLDKDALEDDCGSKDDVEDTTAPIVRATGHGDASMDIIHIHWECMDRDLEEILVRISTTDNIVDRVGEHVTTLEVEGNMGTIDIDEYDIDEFGSSLDITWDTTYYWAVFGRDESNNWSLLSDDAKGTAVIGPDMSP